MVNYHEVAGVRPGSIAEELGIAAGDTVRKINGWELGSILEYRYFAHDTLIRLELEKVSGEVQEIEIENPENEELGIEFVYPLLAPARSCKNKCVFCFIDQLPKGMRETLYFKDDDTTLSFLQGNYVTLTNMGTAELERIKEMRISPINISVHATDPQVRCTMLHNRFAGNIMEIMQDFAANHITMNAQIVLCPDFNDKEILDKSLADLTALHPYVHSVSVVPIGKTEHRQGLCEIASFGEQSARETVEQVEKWQRRSLSKYGSRIVYLADEFYIKAGREIPPAADYEEFPQIENGVGMIASMRKEFQQAMEEFDPKEARCHSVSIATGKAAGWFLRQMAEEIMRRTDMKIHVYEIENTVFGKEITVAGLLCGKDLKLGLGGKPLGEKLLLTENMFKADEDVMLDDTTLEDLEQTFGVPVEIVPDDGFAFVDYCIGREAAI